MGPETSRFADALALEAHQTTEQCCQQHAQHNLSDLRYPGKLAKSFCNPRHIYVTRLNRLPPTLDQVVSCDHHTG